MNYLTITGPISPQTGNNAMLTKRLLGSIAKQNTVRILSAVKKANQASPPETFAGADPDQIAAEIRSYAESRCDMTVTKKPAADWLRGQFTVSQPGQNQPNH